MGFHDVEWAYSIDRPLAETAVLAAICHRTADESHTTFVGQQTVAEMIGSSPEKVLRALKSLELAGVISRTRRHGAGGYRTSDLIRVNVDTYVTNRLAGDSPTRQNAYQENRRDLPDDSSAPTWQIVTAEEINQIDQPEDQPDKDSSSPSARAIEQEFDRAYASWPKKVERSRSLQAFIRAAKARGLETLTADVIRFGEAYAATTERQFVPALAVWLKGERWTDELPSAKTPSDAEWNAFLTGGGTTAVSRGPVGAQRLTPTERAAQTLAAGRRVAGGLAPTKFLTRTEQNMAVVAEMAAMEAAEQAACDHRWMPDGTCNHCTARHEQLEIGAA